MNNIDLINEMSIVTTNITNVANVRLKQHKITFNQLLILIFLSDNQDIIINQKHIRQKFGISHPAAVGIIFRLARNGWIMIQQSESDRRNTEVFLTSKGKKMVIDTKDIVLEIEEKVTEVLSSYDREELISLLDGFREEFK